MQDPLTRRYTLVEIAVTLAIVAIIGAIAWTSTQSQLPRVRLQNAGKLLHSDLLRMRNEAVHAARQTRVVITDHGGDCAQTSGQSGAWLLQIGNYAQSSTEWDTLPFDSGEDGTDDDASDGVVDIGPEGNREARAICLEDPGDLGGAGQAMLVFGPRGWLDNPVTDFEGGFIRLTLVNLQAAADGRTEEVEVTVAPSGHIDMLTRYE